MHILALPYCSVEIICLPMLRVSNYMISINPRWKFNGDQLLQHTRKPYSMFCSVKISISIHISVKTIKKYHFKNYKVLSAFNPPSNSFGCFQTFPPLCHVNPVCCLYVWFSSGVITCPALFHKAG